MWHIFKFLNVSLTKSIVYGDTARKAFNSYFSQSQIMFARCVIGNLLKPS